MRRGVLVGMLVFIGVIAAGTARATEFASTDAVLRWINGYRLRPEPHACADGYSHAEPPGCVS